MERASKRTPAKETPLTVPVSPEDAEMIKKIRKVLRTGKNAEVKQDSQGNTKVFKVSREIEQ